MAFITRTIVVSRFLNLFKALFWVGLELLAGYEFFGERLLMEFVDIYRHSDSSEYCSM